MVIVMHQKATPEEIDGVVSAIEDRGYTARPMPGGQRIAIGILYNERSVDTIKRSRNANV